MQIKFGYECSSTIVVFHIPLNVMNISVDGLLVRLTYNHTAQHTLQLHVCMAVSPSPSVAFFDTGGRLNVSIAFDRVASYGVAKACTMGTG